MCQCFHLYKGPLRKLKELCLSCVVIESIALGYWLLAFLAYASHAGAKEACYAENDYHGSSNAAFWCLMLTMLSLFGLVMHSMLVCCDVVHKPFCKFMMISVSCQIPLLFLFQLLTSMALSQEVPEECMNEDEKKAQEDAQSNANSAGAWIIFMIYVLSTLTAAVVRGLAASYARQVLTYRGDVADLKPDYTGTVVTAPPPSLAMGNTVIGQPVTLGEAAPGQAPNVEKDPNAPQPVQGGQGVVMGTVAEVGRPVSTPAS